MNRCGVIKIKNKNKKSVLGVDSCFFESIDTVVSSNFLIFFCILFQLRHVYINPTSISKKKYILQTKFVPILRPKSRPV